MSTILTQSIAKAIPHNVKMSSKFESGCISRTTRSYAALNQSYSPNANGVISFKIPSVGWIDVANSYLTGFLDFSEGLMLGRSVHSLIRRCEGLASNGQRLFDVDGYNVLCSGIQDVSLTKEELDGSQSLQTLTGSDEYRTEIGSGVSFSFMPLIHFLRSDKFLFSQYTGEVTINLYLDSVQTAFQRVSPGSLGQVTDPNFNVSNVKFVCDVVTMDEEIEALTRQAYMDGRLKWNVESWRFTPNQSQSQNYDMKIETINNSVKGLLIIPRDATKITSLNADSFSRTADTLSKYQIQYGANLMDRVNCDYNAPAAYTELQKLLDFSNTGVITPYNWHWQGTASKPADSSKFMIGQNMAVVKDDNFQGGYSGKSQVSVLLEYRDPLPHPVSYFCYILHDTSITIGQENGVQVIS